jgi:hypothetical protein
MMRSLPALALCTLLGLTGSALAQSVGAPAGSDPATAPGGTEGIAGPRNEREAERRGDAIPAPRGIGIAAPPPMTRPEAASPPPPSPRP